MYLLFECIPDWNWWMTVWNVWKLFLSRTFPSLIMQKEDLDDDCTRLPELVERNDGAKLLPSPEYVAVLTGRMATSSKSTLISVASLSEHWTTVSVLWLLWSQTLFVLPSPKMKDRRIEIMRTILLICDVAGANIMIISNPQSVCGKVISMLLAPLRIYRLLRTFHNWVSRISE